jgi:hypothetical protein
MSERLIPTWRKAVAGTAYIAHNLWLQPLDAPSVDATSEDVYRFGILHIQTESLKKDLGRRNSPFFLPKGKEVFCISMERLPKGAPLSEIHASLHQFADFTRETGTDPDHILLAYTYRAMARAARRFGLSTAEGPIPLDERAVGRLEYYSTNPRYLRGRPYGGTEIIFMSIKQLGEHYPSRKSA